MNSVQIGIEMVGALAFLAAIANTNDNGWARFLYGFAGFALMLMGLS